MKEHEALRESPSGSSRRLWFVTGFCLLVILSAVLLPRQREQQRKNAATNSSKDLSTANSFIAERARKSARVSGSSLEPAATAEQIVANKLSQFARSRRELVHAWAHRQNVEVPASVERFFDAVEAGGWDEMKALFESLREQRMSENDAGTELAKLWPAIMETFGVAAEAQKWPAQKLLDYGNSIMDSLRPGMVYVGGTDPGRFIPTLLNETSGGERHVVLTQNAFADRSYLEYANFLYSDRFGTLTKEDSDRAFQEYMNDAQKRLKHDQDFPNEPKQIRPGEDIRMADNKVQVSGQIAVMAINEALLRILMDKNPSASFAIEQSFPFTSMYGDTRPLGPVMELRVQDEQNAFTHERAAQSVDYWRANAKQLISDAETADAQSVRMTYGKMAAEQAALLLHHGYVAEADQAFRIATEIAPASPEAVFRYMNILVAQKRFDEAIQITDAAIAAGGANQHQFRNLAAELNRMKNR
jgi:hypothetical protein